MSTLEDLDDMERDEKEQKKDGDDQDKKPSANGEGKDADMKDAGADKKEEDDYIDMEILTSSTRDIINRRRLLENEMKILKSEFQRLTHEQNTMKDKIKDNNDKIENNRLIPPKQLHRTELWVLILLSGNYHTLSAMLSNY
jgi:26S proteasome regulatory subunit T5